MAAAGKRLARSLRTRQADCGVSAWDASGIFYEILQGERDLPGASPRTLMLLYAADLAFRLRWQIGPALESGATVVAAPYVDSAIAFGRAAGLPKVWLQELFRFAPKPDESYRVAEDRIPFNKRGKPADSFLEFCFAQLRKASGAWVTEDVLNTFLDQLKTLESRGRCQLVPKLARAAAKGG